MNPAGIENIDFSPVGATNLRSLDVSSALVKEKLSLMILASRGTAPTFSPTFVGSEFEHATDNSLQRVNDAFLKPNPHFIVEKSKTKYGVSLKDLHNLSFFEIAEDYPKKPLTYPSPYCISIRPGAEFADISIYDAVRNEKKCSEEARIEELLHYFHLEQDAYAPFSLNSSRFKPDQFKIPLNEISKSDKDGFVSFQQRLSRWVTAGFPRSYTVSILEKKNDQWGRPFYDYSLSEYIKFVLPDPVFYPPIGAMAFDVVEYHSLPQMRFQRLFYNPDGCGLRQALIPTICLQERIENNWILYNVMTCLPDQKKMPLYNLNKVASQKTDTVVICDCIEDADALQRINEKCQQVAFTSFVPNHMEQTDWSKITGKNVVILISNRSNRSLEDEFEQANTICEYLQNSKIVIAEVSFVYRQVEYPNSSVISSPADLASAYYHNPPHVVGEIKTIDEAEFRIVLDRIRTSHSTMVPWEKVQKEVPKNNERKTNLTELTEDFLVRGFLYKGATTELCAQSGVGKSRFALALGRYVVAGDKSFLNDRFWTRCGDQTVPQKVIYWGFDDITQANIDSWNLTYKEGLTEDFAENFFIEFAPETIKKQKVLNLNAYKKAIMKYTYLGTYGQPPDLLIIDTLSDVAGIEKIFDALSFLSELKKQGFPNLAILAIHHETDIGNLRGGSSARMKPRVIMTMKSGRKGDNNLNLLPMPDEGDEWEMSYAKGTNIPVADIEKIPFRIARDEKGNYAVIDPICTRQEYGKLLKYYYNKKADLKQTNKQVATLLGYGIDSIEGTFNAKLQEIKQITIAINERIKAKAVVADKTEEKQTTSSIKKTRKRVSEKVDSNTENNESEKRGDSEKPNILMREPDISNSEERNQS